MIILNQDGTPLIFSDSLNCTDGNPCDNEGDGIHIISDGKEEFRKTDSEIEEMRGELSVRELYESKGWRQRGGSVTCSKCGAASIDKACWM